MSDVVIIADDLTGANANCSLMKRIGLQAASLLFLKKNEIPKEMDVLAYPTNSRAISKEEAYARVRASVETMEEAGAYIYNKRIDSTLRGNLGPEINGMIDGLGEYRLAVAVPAYPKTHRIVVNGIMLVNGQLLVNSDAGRDTKAPVHTSNVEELFQKNFRGNIKSYYLDDLSKGEAHIVDILKSEFDNKTDLVIFDAVTNEDVEFLAKALIKSEIKYITVDPGPFTLEVTTEYLHKSNQFSNVLMCVGSVTDITKEQLEEVIKTFDPYIVKVDAGKLIDETIREEEMRIAISNGLSSLTKTDLLLVTSTPIGDEKRINLLKESEKLGISIDDASNLISQGLGTIASEILRDGTSFAGAFMSGGDITVALTKEMGAVGIEIKEEIVPLAAYGRIIGGRAAGLRIISKGGMVGDKSTMNICVEKLRNDLNN